MNRKANKNLGKENNLNMLQSKLTQLNHEIKDLNEKLSVSTPADIITGMKSSFQHLYNDLEENFHNSSREYSTIIEELAGKRAELDNIRFQLDNLEELTTEQSIEISNSFSNYLQSIKAIIKKQEKPDIIAEDLNTQRLFNLKHQINTLKYLITKANGEKVSMNVKEASYNEFTNEDNNFFMVLLEDLKNLDKVSNNAREPIEEVIKWRVEDFNNFTYKKLTAIYQSLNICIDNLIQESILKSSKNLEAVSVLKFLEEFKKQLNHPNTLKSNNLLNILEDNINSLYASEEIKKEDKERIRELLNVHIHSTSSYFEHRELIKNKISFIIRKYYKTQDLNLLKQGLVNTVKALEENKQSIETEVEKHEKEEYYQKLQAQLSAYNSEHLNILNQLKLQKSSTHFDKAQAEALGSIEEYEKSLKNSSQDTKESLPVTETDLSNLIDIHKSVNQFEEENSGENYDNNDNLESFINIDSASTWKFYEKWKDDELIMGEINNIGKENIYILSREDFDNHCKDLSSINEGGNISFASDKEKVLIVGEEYLKEEKRKELYVKLVHEGRVHFDFYNSAKQDGVLYQGEKVSQKHLNDFQKCKKKNPELWKRIVQSFNNTNLSNREDWSDFAIYEELLAVHIECKAAENISLKPNNGELNNIMDDFAEFIKEDINWQKYLLGASAMPALNDNAVKNRAIKGSAGSEHDDEDEFDDDFSDNDTEIEFPSGEVEETMSDAEKISKINGIRERKVKQFREQIKDIDKLCKKIKINPNLTKKQKKEMKSAIEESIKHWSSNKNKVINSINELDQEYDEFMKADKHPANIGIFESNVNSNIANIEKHCNKAHKNLQEFHDIGEQEDAKKAGFLAHKKLLNWWSRAKFVSPIALWKAISSGFKAMKDKLDKKAEYNANALMSNLFGDNRFGNYFGNQMGGYEADQVKEEKEIREGRDVDSLYKELEKNPKLFEFYAICDLLAEKHGSFSFDRKEIWSALENLSNTKITTAEEAKNAYNKLKGDDSEAESIESKNRSTLNGKIETFKKEAEAKSYDMIDDFKGMMEEMSQDKFVDPAKFEGYLVAIFENEVLDPFMTLFAIFKAWDRHILTTERVNQFMNTHSSKFPQLSFIDLVNQQKQSRMPFYTSEVEGNDNYRQNSHESMLKFIVNEFDGVDISEKSHHAKNKKFYRFCLNHINKQEKTRDKIKSVGENPSAVGDLPEYAPHIMWNLNTENILNILGKRGATPYLKEKGMVNMYSQIIKDVDYLDDKEFGKRLEKWARLDQALVFDNFRHNNKITKFSKSKKGPNRDFDYYANDPDLVIGTTRSQNGATFGHEKVSGRFAYTQEQIEGAYNKSTRLSDVRRILQVAFAVYAKTGNANRAKQILKNGYNESTKTSGEQLAIMEYSGSHRIDITPKEIENLKGGKELGLL